VDDQQRHAQEDADAAFARALAEGTPQQVTSGLVDDQQRHAQEDADAAFARALAEGTPQQVTSGLVDDQQRHAQEDTDAAMALAFAAGARLTMLQEGSTCPICMEPGPGFELVQCGHCVCVDCAVRYVRTALGNAAEQFREQGIRCVLHSDGCEEMIMPGEIRLLKTASEQHRRDGATPLTEDEVSRFDQFTMESAIPHDSKIHCPRCERILAVSGSFRASGVRECPYCHHEWDLQAHAGEDAATARAIQATSKACPNCGMRITHYHGHDCHHISPSTNGCTACHQHFCYVCLRKHGRPGERMWHPECGHRQTFCNSSEIRRYLERTPYPHDTRCGCPICPDCRPGRPCPQCPGNCVVCLRLVPPAEL